MKKHIFFTACLLLTCCHLIFCTTSFGEVLPRFMLMIEETNGTNGNTGDTERVLGQIIMEQGAEIIDSSLVESAIDKNSAIQALAGNPKAAASIGLQLGADIIIVGKAIAQPSASAIKNTSMKSYQATINIKAIKTDTAEIIYNANGSAAKIHVNDLTGGSQALQAATQQVASNLVSKVVEKQKGKGDDGAVRKLQLVVGNVDEFWQVAEVKKLLRKNVKGVDDVVQRSFVTGSAIFDIHYAGSSDLLAETLSTSGTRKVKLKIKGLSPNKVDAVFVTDTQVAVAAPPKTKPAQPQPKKKVQPKKEMQATKQQSAPPEKQIQLAAVSTKPVKKLPVTESNQQTIRSADIPEKKVQPTPPTTQPDNSTASKIKFGNYYALLIGNSRYNSIESLNTPISDVKAVAKTLSEKYGFKTQFLFNGSRYEMLSTLNDLRGRLTRQDNLLIYYAGHGWLDEATNEGYWLPVDSEKDNSANWLSNSTITNILKSMEAKHVMIVSDSCYSGTLTRSIKVTLKKPNYLQQIVYKKARTVLSSGGLEPVLDSGGDKNHSIFATAFIDALNDNNAPYVETTHLFTKIRRAVMVNSDQTPEYSDVRKAGHNGGEFIFKRYN